jgi:probable HAF family extracellular repeat protein
MFDVALRSVVARALAVMLMALAAVGVARGQAQTPSTYRFTALGTLGFWSSEAVAVNDAGQVVGSSIGDLALGNRAVLWDGASLTDLGPGSASDINNAGQIAGTSGRAATLWQLGGPTLTLGQTSSAGFGINDSGQVVGYTGAAGVQGRATLWSGGSAVDLGSTGVPDLRPPGGWPVRQVSTEATAINNAGQVVGTYTDFDVSFFPQAMSWQSGVSTPLPGLGGDRSVAVGVNDAGQAVGYGFLPSDDLFHAILWEAGRPTDLGTLGDISSIALNVNNAGMIVGAYGDRDSLRAALWTGGSAIDLNTLLRPETVEAGWVLATASDINENGWIVGLAYNRFDSSPLGTAFQGYLLSISDLPDQVLHVPTIPEPSTYALMLAGLGVLAAIGSRKSRMSRRTSTLVRAMTLASAMPAVVGVHRPLRRIHRLVGNRLRIQGPAQR